MAKYAHDKIVPFDDSDLTKKQQVAQMFNKISGRYDFFNRFLFFFLNGKQNYHAFIIGAAF